MEPRRSLWSLLARLNSKAKLVTNIYPTRRRKLHEMKQLRPLQLFQGHHHWQGPLSLIQTNPFSVHPQFIIAFKYILDTFPDYSHTTTTLDNWIDPSSTWSCHALPSTLIGKCLTSLHQSSPVNVPSSINFPGCRSWNINVYSNFILKIMKRDTRNQIWCY